MTTLKFNISINATPEKVWNSLWDSEKYKTWTTPFCNGSYYKTDNFAQGNKIHFLTPNGEGMYSLIDTVRENEFMAFKHLGELKNFEELPLTDETKSWTGAIEAYALKKTDAGTDLEVNVDTFEPYVDYMNKAFPAALNELKRISEN